MLRILIAHLYMCFNSTTVQLIPRAIARNVRVDIVFQFHNGTINTYDCSKMKPESVVSIPQRYN